MDAQHPARLGARRRRARRHRRPARRKQSLGVRRPAVLGRRGRLLHQRLHARQRRVARGGCRGNRPMVPRSPLGRRRLELRVGRGVDSLLVPFHAQRPEGVVVLRDRDRRMRRTARRPSSWREVLAGASAAAHPVDGRTRRAVGDAIRLPVPLVLQRAERCGATSGRRRCTTAAHPILDSRMRSKRSAPPAGPTARGCRNAATPDGSGSRSTCRPASRPSGSRSTAPAFWRGGTNLLRCRRSNGAGQP